MESPTPRNSNPLHALYGSRRSVRWMVLTLVVAAAILLTSGHTSSYLPTMRSPTRKAAYLAPAELLRRPISKDLQTLPKLFHQSWASTQLPAKFERWSATCRQQHPDWEWVLWTDEDNLALVEQHFPWLLKTYHALPGVIYRADLVRNLYMYLYGGVYADLDVECLRPLDQLFADFNVSTTSHASFDPHHSPNVVKSGRRAFLGRMGTDAAFSDSIPNAWMASTAGHPFFLLVLESVVNAVADGSSANQSPEAVTGPARLYEVVHRYLHPESAFAGEALDRHVAQYPTAKHFTPRPGLGHALDVLPFPNIFPYSWHRDGEAVRHVCWATLSTFDAERCKLLLGTAHWPSYAITYWSHTWAGEGHDEGNIHQLEEPGKM